LQLFRRGQVSKTFGGLEDAKLKYQLVTFSSLIGGSDYKLIYRHYATLYFVFCVDSSESELGILDLVKFDSGLRIDSQKF
jgi:hypothetical protein